MKLLCHNKLHLIINLIK